MQLFRFVDLKKTETFRNEYLYFSLVQLFLIFDFIYFIMIIQKKSF